VTVGVLHHFVYPLEGGGEIEVATTRPETMLGDVAVAVHPSDPRFAPFIGRRVRHPFQERTLPVVADAELVQEGLGTGAVKLTPAHDPADFDAAVRHRLPFINVRYLSFLFHTR
jgi:valyl-tRNA synthetase